MPLVSHVFAELEILIVVLLGLALLYGWTKMVKSKERRKRNLENGFHRQNRRDLSGRG